MDFLLECESAITQINAELDYYEDATVERRRMILCSGDLNLKCERIYSSGEAGRGSTVSRE